MLAKVVEEGKRCGEGVTARVRDKFVTLVIIPRRGDGHGSQAGEAEKTFFDQQT